jgi:HTH-type transcriptional regulator / antitoxin HigA
MGGLTFQPDYAVHPGEILRESLEERGMAQSELAIRIGQTEKAVCQMVQGNAPVSCETALKLERALGMPARFWNNLQSIWQEQQVRDASREQLAEHPDWLKLIPWPELVTRGAVEDSTDKADRLARALAFFGVADVPAWWKLWGRPGYAFKRSGNSVKHPGKVAAWLRLGELAASRVECQPFDRDAFLAALKRIRSLTCQPLGSVWPEAVSLCAEAGVAVTLTKPIPSAGIDGATRWLTKDRALIQVSGRHQWEDVLWFAFFHEAGHVLMHGKRAIFLEGMGADSQEEHEANTFAANLLIPPAAGDLSSLKRRSMPATQKAIGDFARSIEVAPGIVRGRMQHDGLLAPSACHGLKRRIQ